jgi:MFS family permease
MPSPEPPSPTCPDKAPRLWTRTFLTILVVNFCCFLGFHMLLPTLSLYLHGKGLSEKDIGLVFGSFTIPAIIFRLLANRLSKRVGTLAIVRVGILSCGCGILSFSLFDHMGLYFVSRLLQGAGFAVSSTLLVSVAATVIPPTRLGEGVGYLGLGATVSLAVGPVIGLWVAKDFGFRAMFVTASFACVVGTFISLLIPKVDLHGARAAAPAPKKPGRLPWVERGALRPSALIFVYGSAVSAITTYLAIYCELEGLPSAASFFMVSTAGTIAARLTAGRIYDRKGHIYVLPPAVILLSGAVLTIILAPPNPVIYAAAVVYGLGAGAVFPSVQALALSSVPPERRTMGSAYFFVAFDLGMGLGTVILGFVAEFFHSYRTTFVGSLFYLAALMLCYFAFYHRRPGRPLPGAGPR